MKKNYTLENKIHSEANINWDSVAKSISDGDAVLVLGPDAIPLYKLESPEESSFSTLSRKLIKEDREVKINYFYEKDNLFLFQDEISKRAARKIIRDIAKDKSWVPDEALLRQIVSMPFHVVLSLSPDNTLFDAFIKYYKEPQFDFCTPYHKTSDKTIDEPTSQNPLLFNLCGNVFERVDSSILDYFDLFQLFIKLLSNSSDIPIHLARKLKEADVYILVGFQLDRWYFQMFLHYLNWLDNNAFTNSNQNFPILSNISDDSSEFILNQFNIKHIAPNRKDFDDLYDACKRRNILREINHNITSLEAQIKVLFAGKKFEDVFKILLNKASEEDRKITIPLLQARYARWEENSSKKLGDSRELEVELNKICHSILTFASSVKQ